MEGCHSRVSARDKGERERERERERESRSGVAFRPGTGRTSRETASGWPVGETRYGSSPPDLSARLSYPSKTACRNLMKHHRPSGDRSRRAREKRSKRARPFRNSELRSHSLFPTRRGVSHKFRMHRCIYERPRTRGEGDKEKPKREQKGKRGLPDPKAVDSSFTTFPPHPRSSRPKRKRRK